MTYYNHSGYTNTHTCTITVRLITNVTVTHVHLQTTPYASSPTYAPRIVVTAAHLYVTSRNALCADVQYIATGMPSRRLTVLNTSLITCSFSFQRCCAIRDERPLSLNTSTAISNDRIMCEIASCVGSGYLKRFQILRRNY